MSKPVLWHGRVLCIVTGASRGLGRAICVQFARDFLHYHGQLNKTQGHFQLTFLLLSRNASLLDDVQRELRDIDKEGHIQTIEPIIGSIEDANTMQSFEQAIGLFAKGDAASGIMVDQVIMVHNAGSLGNPDKLVSDYTSRSSEELTRYFEINLLSVIKMTGLFLSCFHHATNRIVINISSLCALKPFKGLALYCTGIALVILFNLVYVWIRPTFHSKKHPSFSEASLNSNLVLSSRVLLMIPQGRRLVMLIFEMWPKRNQTPMCSIMPPVPC